VSSYEFPIPPCGSVGPITDCYRERRRNVDKGRSSRGLDDCSRCDSRISDAGPAPSAQPRFKASAQREVTGDRSRSYAWRNCETRPIPRRWMNLHLSDSEHAFPRWTEWKLFDRIRVSCPCIP